MVTLTLLRRYKSLHRNRAGHVYIVTASDEFKQDLIEFKKKAADHIREEWEHDNHMNRGLLYFTDTYLGETCIMDVTKMRRRQSITAMANATVKRRMKRG